MGNHKFAVSLKTFSVVLLLFVLDAAHGAGRPSRFTQSDSLSSLPRSLSPRESQSRSTLLQTMFRTAW